MPAHFPENPPHYLEIVTPDVQEMCTLYSILHGWSFGQAVPELGNARVAELPNGSLCGIRAPMHSTENPIVRTYLRVTDLGDSVRQAEKAGCRILLERMELPGHGIIAIYELGVYNRGSGNCLN